MPVLGELARWGYEWAWGPPARERGGRPRRDLPARPRARELRRDPTARSSWWSRDGDERSCYSCTISGTGVELEEREAQDADARVAGDQAAWVRALSPERDRGGLEDLGRPRARRRAAGRPAGRQRPQRRAHFARRVEPTPAASDRRGAPDPSRRLLPRVRRGAGPAGPCTAEPPGRIGCDPARLVAVLARCRARGGRLRPVARRAGVLAVPGRQAPVARVVTAGVEDLRQPQRRRVGVAAVVRYRASATNDSVSDPSGPNWRR